MSQQPTIANSGGTRRFAGFPVAVQGVIVNPGEEILLLAHPQRRWGWEPINGALEAGETVLAGVLRETREEAGSAVRVRPLGTIHAYTFQLDQQVTHMLGISYLLAYEGGAINPGSDMAGSAYRWWKLEALQDERDLLLPPLDQEWFLERAMALYRLWQDQGIGGEMGSDVLPRIP